MKKIYVTLSTFAEYGSKPLDLLSDSPYEYEISTLGRRITKDEIVSLCRDSHGLVAGVEPYDAQVLEQLPQLECISRCGVGTDSIDHTATEKKGIVVCNTPDVVVQPVAELAVSMILGLLRQLPVNTFNMKSKQWIKLPGSLLCGKKVGILGLGRIGKRVAEMLSALGAQVYGTDLLPDKQWAEKYKVTILPNDELLSHVDILSIHLAQSNEHPFVIDQSKIASMKQGAYLINLSRGSFIDERALYEGLMSGKLAGAGLDVYSTEPYTGKLCDCANVILTPHIATLTKESRLQMEIEAVHNLLESLNGRSKN